jgi:hypothetical protein
MVIALPGFTLVPHYTSAVRVDLCSETTLEYNDPFLEPYLDSLNPFQSPSFFVEKTLHSTID